MNKYKYTGTELELFKDTKNWKKYIFNEIQEYIKGDVLEVGAGIGSFTNILKSSQFNSLVALEPDQEQCNISSTLVDDHRIEHICGTCANFRESYINFDTILYIDVLEHINDDANEINMAYSLLKQGGHLIILSPAHKYLFSEFDRSIGHYRRYNKDISMLFNKFSKIELAYLDSVGMLCSLFARLTSQICPTYSQIMFWDKFIIPISRIVDKITFHIIGKSILAIAKK